MQKIYHLPASVKSMMIQSFVAGTVLAVIVTVLAVLAPTRDTGHWPWLYGLLIASYGGTLVCYLAISPCDAYLEVTEETISQLHPRKATVTLHWSEISKVRNNPIMQRLELHSKTKNVRINVEHQIEDYAQLRLLIESRTA